MTPPLATDPEGVVAVEALETAFRRIHQVVKRSAREFSSAVHPEMRPAGWVVLVTVLRGGADGAPVTVGDIIADTAMDKSVVSRLLRSLSEWGLVTMRRSDADARVVVVEATDAARERIGAIRRLQRERYAEILKSWSPEDARRLGELLDRVSDALADWPPPTGGQTEAPAR